MNASILGLSVWSALSATAVAYGLVFLAELGDKTQLIALGFGARYRLRTVMLGLIIGFGAAGALAAAVGGALGAALPERAISIAGGILFIGFAIWTLVDRDDDTDDVDESPTGSEDATDSPTTRRFGGATRSAVITIASAILIGELGDKTQLTTATLAAQSSPFAVWVGATAGEVSAAMIGALIGQRIGARLNPTALRYSSAALFLVFGVLMLVFA